MALFAVNTGLRDSNVCGLQWQWEVAVPEVGRSVFVIPPEAFKTKRPHVVVLNDAARSIIESQRGKHPIWSSRIAAGASAPLTTMVGSRHGAKRDCR
jgi:integrase